MIISESSFISLQELCSRFGLPEHRFKPVADIYPFRVSRHYFKLIKTAGDPAWLQVVPDISELSDDTQDPDPLSENAYSPVNGLIHRYPDRAVFLVSNECATYCRFCMRKRHVGKKREMPNYSECFDYLRSERNIRDVLLSGGDPLMLDDNLLESILYSLKSIRHLEMIRIGSRVPVTFPERITEKLCAILKNHHPLYINTHFNHPVEITEESKRACYMLADAGIPLGNQTVLLKGVNDDPAVLSSLMKELLAIRVKPYYLHQMDLARGTSHFRTPVEVGFNAIKCMRGYTSGLAVPHFVIDLPGGKGKTPLLPDQWQSVDKGEYRLNNYAGEDFLYRDP